MIDITQLSFSELVDYIRESYSRSSTFLLELPFPSKVTEENYAYDKLIKLLVQERERRLKLLLDLVK